MNRFFVFFVFLIFSIYSLAYEKRPALPLYVVESDVLDTTVRRGTCIIEGTVMDQRGNPVAGATISTINKRNQVVTNAEGKFEISISSLDTSIFMFHKTYGEIVMEKYDFKSKHRVVVRFNPMLPFAEEQNVKKPVIYLYAGQPTAVSISLDHPELTFTYPPYDQNWNVTVAGNGLLSDNKTGKMHPYLFWEGNTTGLTYTYNVNTLEGFLISTDTLVPFFETALTRLGLNETEQADFITFWSPQLNHTPYVFVQFLVDEAYDTKIASIDVNPLPDSQRRVCMLYTPLHDPAGFATDRVVPQSLPSFARQGLTLVEWGGVMISPESLIIP